MEKLFALSDVFLAEKVHLELSDNIEWMMGLIIMNRIVGIACKNLDMTSYNMDTRKVFRLLKANNEQRSEEFQVNLRYLAFLLIHADFEYALLKGAFLSTFLYERGQRTSNDIDILIESKDVTKLQAILLQNGFVQGQYDGEKNEIMLASRKEIVESKMNFGETVPFIKMINGKPFEVDINFSVDFKPSENRTIVQDLLQNVVSVSLDELSFKTLDTPDFLIHRCCHLYKEATTYNWVVTKRDLTLYKFSDINVFFHKYGNQAFFEALLQRIRQFEVEKECYYAFENSSVIYPKLNEIHGFAAFMKTLKPNDLGFMTQIIYPREKKLFQYKMDFKDWFFCKDRVSQLEEMPNEAN